MRSPMSSVAAHVLVSRLRSRLLTGGVVASFVAIAFVPSFSAAGQAIPQLGSRDSGWNVNFWDFQLDPPPGLGHGPMKTDPKYPYRSQCQNCGCSGGSDLRPPDRECQGPNLEALGRGAHASNERRGAERQEGAPVYCPIALLAWRRSWPTPFS